jgi:hypothetical protein
MSSNPYLSHFDGKTGHNGWRLVCEYQYTHTLKKERYIKPDGSKSFMWKHRKNVEVERWENGAGGQHIPLFNQPAIERAGPSDVVYVPEGEKDVLTLAQNGRIAVCSPHGAVADSLKGKWNPAYTDALQGRNLVIIQDNDFIGIANARLLALELHGVAASVKILDLTNVWEDLPQHGDISDVLELYGKSHDVLEALDRLAEDTAEFTPDSVPLHDVYATETKPPKVLNAISAPDLLRAEFEPVNYLIDGFLPAQGAHLLAGAPKFGKGWLALLVCLRVAAGEPFLRWNTQQAGTLYLSFEDSLRRLQGRICKLLDGNPPPPWFYFSTDIITLGNGLLDLIDDFIKLHPEIKLVVIDTFQKIRGECLRGERWYEHDYREAGMVKEHMDKIGVSVLFVHHVNKTKDKDDVFNEISGTNGISGVMDTLFVLKKPSRHSKQGKLHITGRDVEDDEFVICMNGDTCEWQFVGDAEELAEQEALFDYQTNIIPKTIKAVLDESADKRWIGSAKNLLDAGARLFSIPLAPSSQALSKALVNLKDILYEQDKIVYTISPNGNAGYRHHFCYAVEPVTENSAHDNNPGECPEF